LNTGNNLIEQGINQNRKVIKLTPPQTKLRPTHTTIPLRICKQILKEMGNMWPWFSVQWS